VIGFDKLAIVFKMFYNLIKTLHDQQPCDLYCLNDPSSQIGETIEMKMLSIIDFLVYERTHVR
jgi:hypothetical protein